MYYNTYTHSFSLSFLYAILLPTRTLLLVLLVYCAKHSLLCETETVIFRQLFLFHLKRVIVSWERRWERNSSPQL